MPEIQTNNLVDHGQLKIQVTSRQRAVPIPNATIEISYTGDPDSVLETVSTDENGHSESTPASFAGFRFTRTITFLPTISSGV